MNAEELREGIFSLRTRRFGTVAEIMIKKMLKFEWGHTISHDLYDLTKKERIEVKFCTALKANTKKITEGNIITEISSATNTSRMFRSNEWSTYKFDCNIQQVKKKEFEVLYYGMFFSDVVEIFKIDADSITADIYYSDKQHAGNEGEGQFHLNNQTYAFHKENYFVEALTYNNLLFILSN